MCSQIVAYTCLVIAFAEVSGMSLWFTSIGNGCVGPIYAALSSHRLFSEIIVFVSHGYSCFFCLVFLAASNGFGAKIHMLIISTVFGMVYLNAMVAGNVHTEHSEIFVLAVLKSFMIVVLAPWRSFCRIGMGKTSGNENTTTLIFYCILNSCLQFY